MNFSKRNIKSKDHDGRPPCPYCRARSNYFHVPSVDGMIPLDQHPLPQPGDSLLCGPCGNWVVFTDGGAELRKPTLDEAEMQLTDFRHQKTVVRRISWLSGQGPGSDGGLPPYLLVG